jgi:hypothetical protein
MSINPIDGQIMICSSRGSADDEVDIDPVHHGRKERWLVVSQRKELRRAYKERRQRGGIYTITNSRNGRYLLCHTADMSSAENRFQFAVSTGSTVDPRVRRDWEEYGAEAFIFTALEEVEQGPEQSHADFLSDLTTLEALWRANLDSAKEY